MTLCLIVCLPGVPPSLYAKYYLELNELFTGLMNTLQVGDGREVWNWEPVSDFTKALLKRKFLKSEADRYDSILQYYEMIKICLEFVDISFLFVYGYVAGNN